MGLRTPNSGNSANSLLLNGNGNNNKNGNGVTTTTNNGRRSSNHAILPRSSLTGSMRKRSRSGDIMPLLPLPNQRNRLSHATLQRIFIIMMGLVFGVYVVLTAYLIHGHSSVLETERQQTGSGANKQMWGLPSATDKEQILREHIQRIRREQQQQQSDTIPEKNNNNNKKPPISSTTSKTKQFLLEEVDIHEMKHPKEIQNNKKGGILQTGKESSTTTKLSEDRILKAYLEPIYLEDWETKPLPVRNTTQQNLKVISYPRLNSCQRIPELWPIDDFPDDDPFLPYVLSSRTAATTMQCKLFV